MRTNKLWRGRRTMTVNESTQSERFSAMGISAGCRGQTAQYDNGRGWKHGAVVRILGWRRRKYGGILQGGVPNKR
jgi:hypothetical protein